MYSSAIPEKTLRRFSSGLLTETATASAIAGMLKIWMENCELLYLGNYCIQYIPAA